MSLATINTMYTNLLKPEILLLSEIESKLKSRKKNPKLELNENEKLTSPSLWDARKAGRAGLALSTDDRKLERSHINTLTAHLQH